MPRRGQYSPAVDRPQTWKASGNPGEFEFRILNWTVTQVRAPPRVMLEGCLNNSRDPAMPNTCRNQRRGLSTVSVFAVQQPTECGQLGCLQDGCSALSLDMRTAERAMVIAAVSQAAPWRAPSAEASANLNERRGDRVHKLGSSRPKSRPLNVLVDFSSSRPRPTQGRASVRRLVAVAATTCSRHIDPAGWEHR